MSASGLALLLALAAGAAEAPLQKIERRVFELVNRERRERGLSQLEWSEPLAAEARHHSRRMAVFWFFSHTDPERGALAKRLREGAIRWRRCGENIFDEIGYKDPALEAVRGWMDSPPHRESILDPGFTLTGVGAALRADGTLFLTQEFITPGPPPAATPGRTGGSGSR
jgi:uncharacterized protein YkwD